ALVNRFFDGATRDPMFADSLPMPVLGFHGPDGRKPIHADDGTTLIPSTSLWEHGLAIVGFYGADKVRPQGGNLAIVQRLARMLAKYGCWLDSDGWWFVADIAYYQGAEIPFTIGKTTLGPKMTWERPGAPGYSGVSQWTLAGLLVATEVLPPDDPMQQKAR